MNEKTSVFLIVIFSESLVASHPYSLRIGQIPESGMNEWDDGHIGTFL
jgi:hypothetical protein